LRDHQRRAREGLALLARDGRPFDIIEAALLVAQEEYSDLDLARERERIAAIGSEAASKVDNLSNPFARLDALRAYLFEELGFCGNTDDYYDPRNSFLNEVLDRRSGIPLTLSILYMEAARCSGFHVYGIALPGHFVVRLDYSGRSMLVDPFRGGVLITEEDCRDLVARSTGRPALYRRELLEGTSPRDMLGRLLRNLKRVYLARKDFKRALGAVERLLLIFPETTTEVRDRGFLLAHIDRPGAAVTDLEAYLDLAPDSPDADAVRGRIAWLRRKMSEIN